MILNQFFANHMVADEHHVYWAYAKNHEYDDEDVYVSSARVERRHHRSGQIDTLFEFKRDDVYCLPTRFGFVRGHVGWLCERPRLEGNGRADHTRFMHMRGGTLHSVPLPDSIRADLVTTDGHDVLFLDHVPGQDEYRFMRLDPITGVSTQIMTLELPRSIGLYVVGIVSRALVLVHRDEQGQESLYIVPLSGDPPQQLRRHHARCQYTLSQAEIVMSCRGHYPAPTALTLISLDGTIRDLFRSEYPFTNLVVHGEFIYFQSHGHLQRAHLATGVRAVICPGEAASVAIGGGFLYWRQDRTLRQHPLP